jgi:ATP-dependent RNA helicase DeaD
VVNYSLPEDPSVFMHRVGRTGRIGKKGTSLSLVSGAEIMTLSALQKKFSVVFEERKLPTPEEAKHRWTERHVAELKEGMSASIFEAYIPLAQQLKARPDGEYLVAFALKYFFQHHRIEKMTDVQKAEHKRQEHERKERVEASILRDREREPRREHGERDRPREGRGERSGRGPRRDRPERSASGERSERGDRPERSERGDRPRETRPARVEVSDEIPSSIPTIEVPSELEPAPERFATPVHEVSAERSSSGERSGRERSNGRSREERPAEESSGEERSSRGRVFVSFGEADGADESKVRELVATQAPGTELQAVELRRSHTFLIVAPEAVEVLVAALHGTAWGEKTLSAEKARRRRR